MAAFVAPIISGLAGLFGSFRKPSVQTNTTNTDSTSTSTPNLSPEQSLLSDTFTKALINRYNTDPNLEGYSAGGLQTINAAGDARSKILSNILASRGQSFSPAASYAQANNENTRLSQGTDFLNTIPLLARQLKGQDIQDLIRGFSALPTATTQHNVGTTNQRGTSLVPQSPIAGALSGFGAGLFAPQGANGGNALDSILSRLFGPKSGGLGFGSSGYGDTVQE